MLTKQIENAQKRIEGRNFEIRKNVLQYDDVMNRQREMIYGQRTPRARWARTSATTSSSMADKLIDAALVPTTARLTTSTPIGI